MLAGHAGPAPPTVITEPKIVRPREWSCRDTVVWAAPATARYVTVRLADRRYVLRHPRRRALLGRRRHRPRDLEVFWASALALGAANGRRDLIARAEGHGQNDDITRGRKLRHAGPIVARVLSLVERYV